MARLAIIDVPLDGSGAGRGEEHAPAALRAAGVVERLGARDAGEIDARIRDTRRDPETGVIGAGDVRRASVAIASAVRELLEARECPLVLGGDCTLLLGVFQALPRGTGLWFVDGHADFFDGESSPTGEAADMELAILTGHGPPGLLDEAGPLIEPADVVLLGHRPAGLHADVARENARLDPAIRALTAPEVRERGAARVGTERRRLARGPPGLAASRSRRARRDGASRRELPAEPRPRLGRVRRARAAASRRAEPARSLGRRLQPGPRPRWHSCRAGRRSARITLAGTVTPWH